MSALSEQAVRERGILIQGIPITGTINVDVDGFVTRRWEHLTAVCPRCNETVKGSLQSIVNHVQDHAEEIAMQQIRKRNAKHTARRRG